MDKGLKVVTLKSDKKLKAIHSTIHPESSRFSIFIHYKDADCEHFYFLNKTDWISDRAILEEMVEAN